MSRLLLVEGIPGTGKSTSAGQLAGLLRDRGQRCALFLEGERQPVDLAWQWWLTSGEFDELLRRWPQAADTLRATAWHGRAGVSVAYDHLEPKLERQMEGREPLGGVVSPEHFVDVLAERWAEVGQDEAARPGFVVFESAILQDTLVELVLFAEWDEQSIAAALQRLLAGVADLDPVVLRLVTEDPAATVLAAAAVRVDEHGRAWWQEAVRGFMAATPWVRSRGLGPDEAFLAYLEQRLALEDRLRASLPVTWVDLVSPAGGSGGWQRFDVDLAALADGLVAEARPARH